MRRLGVETPAVEVRALAVQQGSAQLVRGRGLPTRREVLAEVVQAPWVRLARPLGLGQPPVVGGGSLERASAPAKAVEIEMPGRARCSRWPQCQGRPALLPRQSRSVFSSDSQNSQSKPPAWVISIQALRGLSMRAANPAHFIGVVTN
jgi:hypothetical protein